MKIGIVAGVIVALALGLLTAGVLFLRGQVAASLAVDSPTGIDESGYVTIGGVPQYISIRGSDIANPVILFVHGGPGGAVMGASYQPFLAWEGAFTVVQWDQRGAGMTYAANGYDASAITVERLTSDGAEVAEYVRERLEKPSIILLGHSWGSHLGAKIAQRRPDLFSAFVATGLWVNFEQSQAALYDRALATRRLANNEDAVRSLERVAPLPFDDLERWKTILRWSADEGDSTFPSNGALFLATLLSPEYPLLKSFSYFRGFNASSEILGKEAMHDNLDPSAPFGMPIFLFQGDEDGHVDPGLAQRFFEAAQAPAKEVVVFEGGGHSVHVTQQERFVRELIDRVRPLGE